jgi:hypothetical protein
MFAKGKRHGPLMLLPLSWHVQYQKGNQNRMEVAAVAVPFDIRTIPSRLENETKDDAAGKVKDILMRFLLVVVLVLVVSWIDRTGKKTK